MRIFLFFSIALFTFSLTSTAKNVNRHTYHQSDTLKKGKNYFLFSKSENIQSVNFNKTKKAKENIVYFRFGFPTPIPSSNGIQGNILQSNRKYTEDGSVPIFDKIDILTGKYTDIKMSKDTNVRNLFKLTDIEFPLRLKLHSGKEHIDLELTEAGEWNIGIELKNN
ncbi:hypothetical protein EZ428_23395 [Pedobacter frigiditerrae]|uniref:Uncharacterized protein n=1 Tax=Pedobacter frigiditerrae TaxID=2530452 RepID=A0A4V2MHI6_9SPHI|nr:hypothetical protein [Pedobacter frigiditerrae]TCC86656.1 hypothetical protein EZ428_23395 [Pedobacter frigiditerrae]